MPRVFRALVIGFGAAALVLSGCSTTSTRDKTTVAEGGTASSESSGQTPKFSLPQPPTGASQVKFVESDQVMHARYSIQGQSPQQVIDYYVGAWKHAGYLITGVEGGGYPGRYGGSGASAYGLKPGVFVAVDAGAGNGGPTYFNVCQGTDQKAVRRCAHHGSN
ncbi:MAG: hypothetical protein KDB71_02630 [Mycobacterium sp.]|nr:hypothetical protein [Mycobacterium sp.]